MNNVDINNDDDDKMLDEAEIPILSQPNSNPRRSWGDHIIEWNPPPHPTQTFKALPGNPGR